MVRVPLFQVGRGPIPCFDDLFGNEEVNGRRRKEIKCACEIEDIRRMRAREHIDNDATFA